MKNRSSFTSIALLLSVFAVFSGCKKDNDSDQPGVGTVTFEMETVAGSKKVAVDGTTKYGVASGDTIKITTFKYYLSNLVLTRTDGSTYAVPKFYHLVDASDAASTEFTVSDVPTGDYSAVQFMVGVDSTTTKADPLTFTNALNDLNPAKNMYWVWNTGHIFLKLEGSVTTASNNPVNNKGLLTHIGGFRDQNNATVTAKPSLNGANLLVRAGHEPEIHYTVDVQKIFNGKTRLPLSTFPSLIMAQGAIPVQLAQNYGVGTTGGGMFSVAHIHAN